MGQYLDEKNEVRIITNAESKETGNNYMFNLDAQTNNEIDKISEIQKMSVIK